MRLQETTRFRLATGQRKKYSQTIHVNTVGAHHCQLPDDPLHSTLQATLNTGRHVKGVYGRLESSRQSVQAASSALSQVCATCCALSWSEIRECAGSRGNVRIKEAVVVALPWAMHSVAQNN